MKVMLIKDVLKLGRAGEVKKVADGYGRNYLIPKGLAVLATPGALKQAERIRENADVERARLNQELGEVAERLQGLRLTFGVKASETGTLYGSVTLGMIAEAIQQSTGAVVEPRQIDGQPIKTLGVHQAHVRLTIDLNPEITIVVHLEGEPPESVEELQAAAEEPPQSEKETPEAAADQLAALAEDEQEEAAEDEQAESPDEA
ncbi:MAG: 50S ribosomal protein L9 [Anaerolineales bacterium]|jgi:large subunit ribosomal protein L9